MDGEIDCSYTVEDVFKDFRARRVGIIKALTIEVKKFRQLCDPGKENLCLYAYPDQTWEVKIPSDVVPEDSPEPIIGINFARDGMKHEDWLSLVAMHSSSWLISLAFYFGARFGFDKTDRMRLFKMINDLPSLNEIISISVEKETKKLSPQTGSNMKNEIISYSVEKETKELSPQSNSNIKNEIAISDSFEEVTMELSPQTSSNIKNRTPKRIRKYRRKHRKCSH